MFPQEPRIRGEKHRERIPPDATVRRGQASPRTVVWVAGVLAVLAISSGLFAAGNTIEFDLCPPAAPVEADSNEIRMVLKESSDITTTTFTYVGSRRIARRTPRLEYHPRERLTEVIQAAGFGVIPDDSSEPGIATLFVDYRERKRSPGLDAPTAFYLSYTLFHRSAGLIASGSTEATGRDTSPELEGDPAFVGLGEALATALAAGDLEPARVSIPTSIPKPKNEPGVVATIPEEHEDFGNLVMSPDRRTIAYTARIAGERVVVRGAEVVDRYDTLVDRLVYHPNGETLGYTVRTGGASYAGINGRAGCAFESASGFQFSPDGMHYAMVARRGEKSFVIVDGREDPAFNTIKTTVAFGPDGTYAYWAVDEKRLVLVKAGAAEASEWKDATRPSFAPDGRLAYVARGGDGEGWTLVVGDNREPVTVEGEVLAGPIFSPSGNQHAAIVRNGASSFVSIGGRSPRLFKGDVSGPALTKEGEHIAYRVREGSRELVVVDGRESGRYEQVLGPVSLSADGSRVSFGVREGRQVRLEELDTAGLRERRIKEPLWTIGPGSLSTSVPPTVDGGLVYVSTRDSTVRAFDAETGTEGLSFSIDSFPVIPKFAVKDGLVVVLLMRHGNQQAFAFDSETGAELWRVQANGISGWDTSPAIYQGKVFLISQGKLAVAGAKTGGLEWSKGFSGGGPRNFRAPVAAGSIVLVAKMSGSLHAFDLNTGADAWSRQLEGKGRVVSDPVISEQLALVAFGDRLHAVDLLTGEERWVFEAPGTILAPSLVDGQIWFGTDAGDLRCLDVATGTLLSSRTLGQKTTRPEISAQQAYIAPKGDLRAIDLESGEELWRVETPWKKSSPPVISGDTVYFTAGEKLIAVRDENIAPR